MDPFVRKLVERMLTEGAPLSRNRHFHALDNPEGQTAVRIVKRLRALHADLLRCSESPGAISVRAHPDGGVNLRLALAALHSQRTATLSRSEWDILQGLPGAKEALQRGALHQT